MHMRWPRPHPGSSGRPGPVILLAVGLLAFASTFGLARAAGGNDPAGSPAGIDAQQLALRTASDLPAMKGEPGPTQAELEAQRAKARKRRQAKRREERKAAEEKAAREERLRLRAERRAQRAAEREAEAERKLAAERRKQAQERKRQQEESAPKQPVETTAEAPPPTTTSPTTPDGQPFDDSG